MKQNQNETNLTNVYIELCKDKEIWCRFADCSNAEAANLCPSTCNLCETVRTKKELENIEGDIVARITRASDDHQLPNKVLITIK